MVRSGNSNRTLATPSHSVSDQRHRPSGRLVGFVLEDLAAASESSREHAVLWESDGTPTDLGNLGGRRTLLPASTIEV